MASGNRFLWHERRTRGDAEVFRYRIHFESAIVKGLKWRQGKVSLQRDFQALAPVDSVSRLHTPLLL